MCGYRHGALEVVETVGTRDHLNRELQRLDSRLFIERQKLYGEKWPVWCVCINLGPDPDRGGGIYAIYEHRDPNGVPIGYPTQRMVEKVQEMMRRGPINPAEIERRNRELRETRQRASYERLREMAHDHARFSRRQLQPLTAGMVNLRRARADLRASGHFEKAEATQVQVVTRRPSVVRKG